MFDAGARQFFLVRAGKIFSQTVLQPILICDKTILLGSDNVKTYASVFRAGCPNSLLSAWPRTARVIILILACAYCVPPTWKSKLHAGLTSCTSPAPMAEYLRALPGNNCSPHATVVLHVAVFPPCRHCPSPSGPLSRSWTMKFISCTVQTLQRHFENYARRVQWNAWSRHLAQK